MSSHAFKADISEVVFVFYFVFVIMVAFCGNLFNGGCVAVDVVI